MGRIVPRVTMENPLDPTKRIETDALIDAGAFMLTLPRSWQDRLGTLEMRDPGSLYRHPGKGPGAGWRACANSARRIPSHQWRGLLS